MVENACSNAVCMPLRVQRMVGAEHRQMNDLRQDDGTMILGYQPKVCNLSAWELNKQPGSRAIQGILSVLSVPPQY